MGTADSPPQPSPEAPDGEPLEEQRPPTFEHLLLTALNTPLDLTARALESVPATVDKARQQVVVARFIGKMAVSRGSLEVRRRWRDLVDVPVGTPDEPITVVARTIPTRALPADTMPNTGPDRRAADALALPDYDHLPAAHVVAKLPNLSQDERDAIEAHELAGRHRRTVLGKLDQLRDSSPDA